MPRRVVDCLPQITEIQRARETIRKAYTQTRANGQHRCFLSGKGNTPATAFYRGEEQWRTAERRKETPQEKEETKKLTKRQHSRYPTLRQLQRKAFPGHRILRHAPALHPILRSGTVDGGFQVTRAGKVLLADQDREVVVGHVHAGVALGLQRGAEEDQILGDGGVEDHHHALYC